VLKLHALEIAAFEGGANSDFLDAHRLQSGHAVGGQKQRPFSVSTTA